MPTPPADILVPSQSAATARWWALRWYKNASVAEREAMRQVLDECGTGAVQMDMDFNREGTGQTDCSALERTAHDWRGR